MITCFLHYIIDLNKIQEFETYAKLWVPLVDQYGGQHHGYFLPHEGANNIAYALFSFPSLTAYEKYRIDSITDKDCMEAYTYAKNTHCIVSYSRNFLRPIFK